MVTLSCLVEQHLKVWQNTGVKMDTNSAIQLAKPASVLVYGAEWHQGVNLNQIVHWKVSNSRRRTITCLSSGLWSGMALRREAEPVVTI